MEQSVHIENRRMGHCSPDCFPALSEYTDSERAFHGLLDFDPKFEHANFMQRRASSPNVAGEYTKTKMASHFGFSRTTRINASRVVIELDENILIFQTDVLHPDVGHLHCFYNDYWYALHGDENWSRGPSDAVDADMDWKNTAFVFPLAASVSQCIETHVLKEKVIHLFSRTSATFNRFMYMGEMAFEEIMYLQGFCDRIPDPDDPPERHVVLVFKDHDELPDRESFWTKGGIWGTPSHCRPL